MDHQMAFWKAADSGIRRFILSYPRRGGKDLTSCSYLAREALKTKGTYWILGETKTQAIGIYWNTKSDIKFKDHYTQKTISVYGSILDICIPHKIRQKTNVTDKSITLHNGSVIKLGGTSDESFVGQTGLGFIITEYSLSKHSDFMLALLNPILSQSGGWLIVNGTQRTDDNRLLKMIVDNKNSKMWFVDWLTMGDLKEYCWVSEPNPLTGLKEFDINPHLLGKIHYLRGTPIENIQHTVDSEPHRKSWYMREYLNIPTSIEENSYYEEELQLTDSLGHINNVDVYHDSTKPVYTAWDLGMQDSTAITFFQIDIDNNPIIIDYYESKGHNVGFYIDVIKGKLYTYGNHFVPIDSSKRSYQLGVDLVEFARNALGFTMTKLPKTLSLRADIELVRDLIPKTKFREDTTEGLLKCLYGYHEDERTGKPKHNSTSHGADSFRYMCVAIQAGMVVPILSSKYFEDLVDRVDDEQPSWRWEENINTDGFPMFTEVE